MKYSWEDIKKDIKKETPSLEIFGNNDPYSNEEIEQDKNRVRGIKAAIGYRETEGLADSQVQEYTTQQDIIEMDWFSEGKRESELFGNRDIIENQTITSLTSEYDDFVNHIDVICVVKNTYSDFQPVPFALDLTYGTDIDQLDKKFSWRHPYNSIDTPGFCTAKYFIDTDSLNDEQILPKGRIKIMPRFIVGYDEDLSQRISELRIFGNSDKDDLIREESSMKAKFCVLKELKLQSEQMLEFLTKNSQKNKDFKKMLEDVTALNQYFKGALETARKHDPHDLESYSNKDEVVNAITSRNIVKG